jgi:NADH-quinone oxidoreductase subunit F
MRLATTQALEERRSALAAAAANVRRRVLVCAGTGCVAGGAVEIFADLVAASRAAGLPVEVSLEPCGGHGEARDVLSLSGCHGFCQMGPLVHVLPDDILYCQVKRADVAAIVEQTLVAHEVIKGLLFEDPDTGTRRKGRDDIVFYNRQTRVALEGCGVVDPESLDDYIAHGGYAALTKALTGMTPDEVVDAVVRSGLRGRGGGGYPTGRKWRSCLAAGGDVRYVICNGDEGDPGAFMDRSIMEGDPFKVIEGMTIGAYALRSAEGYIYVRHEYPLAVERLRKAIAAAREEGLLGDDILGSGFSFDVRISRGGGAFVCGESSALMQSIEGKVGEPRPKYVHSTERGLFDRPTVLNNVETWVTVPPIVQNGPEWFAAMGTKRSAGTKAFSLVGKVKNTGLVEVPMGISLREIIFDIGGGIRGGKRFKAVQTGGPSGGCLPASMLDSPVDFDTLTAAQSMMGSGGMIVMDERNCMVDVARYFIGFLIGESCGKCVPCREGLLQLAVMLDRICAGEGRADDVVRIERLCRVMETASLCALGRSAVNPVLSTLRHFGDEYEAHIGDRRCPAGVCKALVTYRINERCDGCMLCVKPCPVGAISGERKQRHVLDATTCTRCGACEAVCPSDAVTVE